MLATLILCLGIICTDTQGSMIAVDYQGETFVRPNSIERSLVIRSGDVSRFDIAVKPLDDALKSSDGRVRIPLEYVYLNNTKEDVYLRYNQYSNLFRAHDMNGVVQTLTAKVRDYGMVPAGTYYLNFEIQAIDAETQTLAGITNFNLQFIVPTIQQINLFNEVPRINISAKEAFMKNHKIASETAPMVYINSNCDWELLLNSDGFGEKAGRYYVRTINASSNVEDRLKERVELQPGKDIVLAKGKAPANNEYVSVEFSVEGENNKFIKAGNYQNTVRYILREVND